MTDTDDELRAIAAGDHRAFARWLAVAEPSLRRRLRSFAADCDVEAVLQEALLRAWQVAPRVVQDGQGNSLLRVTATIARHLAIDEVRRHDRRRATELDEGAAAAPEVRWADPRVSRQIRACLDGLAPQPASAWRARLEDSGERHDRELAEAVGMSLNTFLKNIGRARAQLAACLRAQGIGPEELA